MGGFTAHPGLILLIQKDSVALALSYPLKENLAQVVNHQLEDILARVVNHQLEDFLARVPNHLHQWTDILVRVLKY